ncbi:hypothetical protein [Clostridium botulinum]|uniref:hypothetical protein n=1 Tax=Clostridium botulinum TaxID=1491 RepID=UPI0007730194|nr:hypothetical protein [Clostridium botulinum]NFE96620.1 hypothetical protein [Clostridium botulinum]NFL40098.1 hypothetical protein [Clostridium botulinum]NFL67194.1 hypothetical protein [Clostridium botulinum]NFN09973.1 hypothetical protein [Clostridium botulinum]NFN26760.1 hypothetical protein [Clostridium botulinum]
MSEKAKEEKREYMREYMKEYRKKNKFKIQEIQEKYWENKALKKEKEFINKILNDPKVMHELKSEKLAERLITDETGAFYFDDLVNEIIKDITKEK